MATDLKESQTKDLLRRDDIRTMKKDLIELREADSLAEKKKISNIEIPVLKPQLEERVIPPITLEPEIIPGEMPDKIPAPAIEEKPTTTPPIPTPSFSATLEDVKKEPEKSLGNYGSDDSFESMKNRLEKILQSRDDQKSLPKSEPNINQDVKPSRDSEAKAKSYANETEKQQIFLLQSKKTDLEKQLKTDELATNSSFTLERNKMLSGRKDWQEKLATLKQEEQEIAKALKAIQHKEKTTHVHSEKEKLEKEKLAKEEQKQDIEKKSWSAESELAKIEKNIKSLDEDSTQSQDKESSVKAEIVNINASLKAIYVNILERQKTSISAKSTGDTEDKEDKEEKKSDQWTQPIAKPKADAPKMSENNISEEKEYLKGVPLSTKEKLVKSAEVEQVQRLKFMEDVEKWAALPSSEQGDKEIN